MRKGTPFPHNNAGNTCDRSIGQNSAVTSSITTMKAGVESEEEGQFPLSESSDCNSDQEDHGSSAQDLLGLQIEKHFSGYGWFKGTIKSYDRYEKRHCFISLISSGI